MSIENKYLYISDGIFMNKYSVKKKTEYLPIINTNKYKLDEIVNSKFLIYFKSFKSARAGYYGYFEGTTLLISSKISKELNVEETENIVLNETLYKNMIREYELNEVSNLVFIKYDKITKFSSLVLPIELKQMCDENKVKPEKFSSRLNRTNIVKYDINEIIELIENELKKESDDEESDDEDTDDEIDDEDKDSDDDESDENSEDIEDYTYIKMKIPILWIPCDETLNKIKNKNIKTIDILNHYKKCEKCEVVDNNRQTLEFNKKINFLIFDEDKDKMVNDIIIDYYLSTKEYKEKDECIKNAEIDLEKINIIYNEYEDELYTNCIFIVYK